MRTSTITKLFITSVGIVLSQTSLGLDITGNAAQKLIKNATKVHVFEGNPYAFDAVINANTNLSINSITQNPVDVLNTVQGVSLQKIKSEKDLLGRITHRYQQYFLNIPIEWSQIVMHEKAGRIERINGVLYHNPELKNIVSISKNAAWLKAIASVNGSDFSFSSANIGKTKEQLAADIAFIATQKIDLCILPDDNAKYGNLHYAYNVNVKANDPYGDWNVYVDAQTGEILNTITNICTENSKGTAKTKYSGIQTITVDSLATDSFILRGVHNDVMLTTFNSKTGMNENNSVMFSDKDNYWDNFNSKKDEAATDAHWALEKSLDYYKDFLGRNSYDGSGGELRMYMHWGVSWFNANYSGGGVMHFGDGSGEPLTSVDVVGHELSHGVTGETARLVYAKQSGGLNESFSDIFGQSIEFYAKPDSSNWRIGERSFRLRNMSFPNDYSNPDTYNGTFWTKTENCTPSQTNDQCGVHNNSGVQNFWYYLLVEGGEGVNDIKNSYKVEGVGLDLASKVAYLNLSGYLTPNSDYEQAAYYSIVGAADISGNDTSNLVRQVTEAWYAVGIGQHFSAVPISNFKVKQLSCSSSTPINFENLSQGAITSHWFFGDGTESEERTPSHQYGDPGVYDVTLIVCNSNECDTIVKKAFVSIYDAADAPKVISCKPKTSTSKDPIGTYNVTLGSINYNSGLALAEKYADFTCVRTNLDLGGTYPISITTDTVNKVYTRVWIDYNNDANLDASELVFQTDSVLNLHQGTITVPTTAVTDVPLRLRVISAQRSNNDVNNPCANVKFGQVEDYAVTLRMPSGIVGIKGSLGIFPNPAKNTINITIPSQTISGNVMIYNNIGQVVVKESINSQTKVLPVNTSNLTAGVYQVILNSNTGSYTSKLVIE